MRAIHKATKVAVGSPKKSELKGFFVRTRTLFKWKCILLMASYCCDITKRKDMSKSYRILHQRGHVLDCGDGKRY